MIVGSVSSNGHLTLPVRVLDANGYVHRFEAVVDTGFDGYLSLLPFQIRDLGLGPALLVDMVLANDVEIQVNSYEGIALWGGERRPVRILEAEGTPLIGISLLWGSLLNAEIIDNGDVTVSRLAAAASSPDGVSE